MPPAFTVGTCVHARIRTKKKSGGRERERERERASLGGCGQFCGYDIGYRAPRHLIQFPSKDLKHIFFLEIVVPGHTGWVGGPFFSASAACFLRSERPSFWEKTFVKPLDRLDLVHTLSFDDIMQDPHWTNEARNAMRTRTCNCFHCFFSFPPCDPFRGTARPTNELRGLFAWSWIPDPTMKLYITISI